ncbi:ATP-dependent DNA helicase pfh1 [Frankliniella fusca]|uniref:ATP-dependent DNA helicase n=1 Tax=Frankliniella fusca TaxID=407009 RepID=A0AAE1I1Z7_9NEOP|nr:ATP-dependent DNA helicase pfh1 [Frankliniella fusca]
MPEAVAAPSLRFAAAKRCRHRRGKSPEEEVRAAKHRSCWTCCATGHRDQVIDGDIKHFYWALPEDAAVPQTVLSHVPAFNIIGGPPAPGYIERDSIIIVDDLGGRCTGKSLIIKFITNDIQKKLGKDAILLLGPTEVSALQIKGQTIHSGLHINQERKFKDLEGATLINFPKKNCTTFKFLVIDEYSMIGATLLRKIDLRLRQAKENNEPFGNVFLYLMGDIRQLPPILECPLYGESSDSFTNQGRILLHTFDKLLDRISNGEITEEDYTILSRRFATNVKNHSHEFDDAMKLFATKDKVLDHNLRVLDNLTDSITKQPVRVAKIQAKHNNSSAAKGTEQDAEGLYPLLYLTQWCKVMCKHNFWVKKGLVNGSIGTVKEIIYKDFKRPPYDKPEIIMCHFPSFTGQGIGPENLVPIPCQTRSWTNKQHIQCTRQQFPLEVAYACSIYKSQGLTLDKVSRSPPLKPYKTSKVCSATRKTLLPSEDSSDGEVSKASASQYKTKQQSSDEEISKPSSAKVHSKLAEEEQKTYDRKRLKSRKLSSDEEISKPSTSKGHH